MWHPGLKEVRIRGVCAICGICRPQKYMRCDHIDPVVPPDAGFTDWNTYIARMFDAIPDGIQYLCVDCHTSKTTKEREQRKAWRTWHKSATAQDGSSSPFKKSG